MAVVMQAIRCIYRFTGSPQSSRIAMSRALMVYRRPYSMNHPVMRSYLRRGSVPGTLSPKW